jgi:hypothetical protein
MTINTKIKMLLKAVSVTALSGSKPHTSDTNCDQFQELRPRSLQSSLGPVVWRHGHCYPDKRDEDWVLDDTAGRVLMSCGARRRSPAPEFSNYARSMFFDFVALVHGFRKSFQLVFSANC